MAGRKSIVYMRRMPDTGRHNRALLILMIAMMAIIAVTVVVEWRIVASGPRDQGTGAGAGVSIGGPFTLADPTGATVTHQN